MSSNNEVNPFKDDMTGRLLLGKYRTVRRLATGGMGVVYLARSEGAEGFVKPVVVKIILPSYSGDESFLAMFIREAKILSLLDDPGIVSVIDFAQENDFYIMVLEYVHGFQLREWIRYLKRCSRQIPTDVVIHVILKILEALHHAHTLTGPDGKLFQIIHRDISPSNILINTEGRIKIVDFGIARMEQLGDGYKTRTGSFKGKLAYSAPERFANNPATVQSDIYSVGVTLHEMLVGRNEFYTKDHASTIARVINHVPSAVRDHRPEAPELLDGVIAKALEKNPEDRYQTAAHFMDGLRPLLSNSYHVNTAFLGLIKRDFTDEMADVLKVESLSSREQAWRYPSVLPEFSTSGVYADTPALEKEKYTDETKPIRRYSESMPVRGEENIGETAVLTPRRPQPEPITGDKQTGTGLKWVIGLIIFFLLGVGIIVGYLLLFPFSKDIQQPKVVLVQSPVASESSVEDNQMEMESVSPSSDSPVEIESDTGSDPTPPVEVVDRPTASKKVRSAGSRLSKEQQQINALTNAFKKKKRAVRNCFTKHPNNAQGIPKIVVLFSITASGKVTRASVNPSSLNNTSLGSCIKSVAKTTKFPKQQSDVSFSIPVTVTN